MDSSGVTMNQRETLSVFGDHPPGTPLTTSEVTAELDVGRRSTYNRLERLVEAGHIETKAVGSRGRVWWQPHGPAVVRVTDEVDDLFARIDHAFFAVDTTWRLTHLNSIAAEEVGRPRDELRGESVWDVGHPVFDDRLRSRAESAFADLTTARFDAHDESSDRWFDVQLSPTESGMSFYLDEVTESKRRQRELEQYETILETINDGVYVVDDDGRFELVNDAYADMLGLSPEELVGRQAGEFVSDETATRARELNQRLIEGDQETARLEADVYRGDGSTFRGEATFTTFERDDGTPCRIGVVRDVTERARREARLERQQDELAAMNDLNRVVQDITSVVIEQTTREAMEQAVCDALADTASYRCAWIGGIDPAQRTVYGRVAAGIDAPLADLTVPLDPVGGRSRGITARATASREVQVTTDALPDADVEPWIAHADHGDVRSAAAVPISYADTTYGVLLVTADRTHAFGGQESGLFAHLGEVIGHGIASLERKRALLGDEVVELTFRIDSVVDDPGRQAGRITIERMIPRGDGSYLAYGSAPREMQGVLDGFVDDLPHWTDVDYLQETPDGIRYEARLVDPPVITTVTELGGYVDHAAIEDGAYFVEIHLAPSAEASRVIEAVTTHYPGARLVTRRQRPRGEPSPARMHQVLADALTERQRTVLDTAFSAGYFESPRTCSGETVADALDITATTFHQHLRKAQQRIFEVLLETRPVDDSGGPVTRER